MSRLTLRPARFQPADMAALAAEKLHALVALFPDVRRRRGGARSRDLGPILRTGLDRLGLWAAYAVSAAVYLAVIVAIFYV